MQLYPNWSIHLEIKRNRSRQEPNSHIRCGFEKSKTYHLSNQKDRILLRMDERIYRPGLQSSGCISECVRTASSCANSQASVLRRLDDCLCSYWSV